MADFYGVPQYGFPGDWRSQPRVLRQSADASLGDVLGRLGAALTGRNPAQGYSTLAGGLANLLYPTASGRQGASLNPMVGGLYTPQQPAPGAPYGQPQNTPYNQPRILYDPSQNAPYNQPQGSYPAAYY